MILNRVNAGAPSEILGKLTANGNVVIVNPSGVMFGKDATIDVNGLIATSSNLSTTNFMRGNLVFDIAGESTARVENAGTITAKEAGLVGLVAPEVNNSGIIDAKLGTVHLASGDRFSVDLYGDGLMNIAVSDTVQKQLVKNSGSIQAQGGTIYMTAATGSHIVQSLIQAEGELLAPTFEQHAGKIVIRGDAVSHSGRMEVSGTQAGSVTIAANKLLQQGSITANSSAGKGGNITLSYDKAYLDNQNAILSANSAGGDGGTLRLLGGIGAHAFLSGTYDVSSTHQTGGSIALTAAGGDLKLMGAQLKADGASGGGSIAVGGDYQGGGSLAHSATTSVNYASLLSANALDTGTGGNIVVWSDAMTKFAGRALAQGGTQQGDGGRIELSSTGELLIDPARAITQADAPHGIAGTLLLDPKNITIANGGISGGISYFEFVDPNPNGYNFAYTVIALSGGNVVVTDMRDDLMASNAGAAYLYNGSTGALISTLTGSQADDYVGWSVTALTNGNYVVGSSSWANGAATNAGAVTWANGVTGVSGQVSAANSLVGTQ